MTVTGALAMQRASDAEAHLGRLAHAARRAATALDDQDDAVFAAAVAECEALRAALEPLLSAITAPGARTPAASLALVRVRAEEAAAEHGRLAERAGRQRDQLAHALAQLDRPDHVANAYAAVGAPRLDLVR